MGDSRVHTEAKSTTLPALASTLERSSFLQRNSDENELEPIQGKFLSHSGHAIALPPPLGSHSFGQVSAHFTTPRIQTKLTIGQPNDRYEQEADHVASQVMRMQSPELSTKSEEEIRTKPLAKTVTPLIQRKIESEEEDTVQAKPDSLVQREKATDDEEPVQAKGSIQRVTKPEEEEPIQARAEDDEPVQMQSEKDSDEQIQTKPFAQNSTSHGLESQLRQTKGGGSPLSDDVRSFMESRFGADLSHVRVHTGASAVQMNKTLRAQAFTHGRDIYFGSGRAPGQNDLTAHELTHVIQQTGAKTLQRKPIHTLKPYKTVLQAKISSAGADTIQRKLAPKSPASDPSFRAVVKRTKDVAKQQKKHLPAKTKAAEAQAASVPPPNDKESKAQDRQVQEMNQQQPGQFDAAKFKAAVLEKINAATPQNLDQADKFKDSNKLGAIKSDLSSQVGAEKEKAAGPIEDKTKEPPKTGGIPEKAVTPLPPSPPLPPPANIGASQATPKPKDASEISMQEGSQSLDQQMTDAKVTTSQLEKSGQPEFKTALDAKKDAQTDAKTSPAEYRQQEKATLTDAKADAQKTAQVPLQGMRSQKAKVLSQVLNQQGATKGQDEQKRKEVADRIEGFYTTTKQKVETLLNSLDGEVNQEFDRGTTAAKSQFDSYVDQEMRLFKERRYSGAEGKLLWVKDVFLPLPDEVNKFYKIGRQKYITSMTATIDRVANIVVTKLNAAKAEITKGKQDIQKYVASLDPSLRKFGQDAAKNIQSKFNDLEQSVDNKQNELIDSLAQKYNENLQALDADIEKRKAENQGLVGKAKAAIAGVVQTILELKNMLIGVLAKAAGVVEKIIQDPIAFLGNLIAGIKQGFMNFAGNIVEHLKKGLIGWLMGALAGAGIEMPKSFDLKGIFALVASLLGLTYAAIRNKVTNKVGEKAINALEKGFDMFMIWKSEGLAGLWKFIQDKLTNLKEMVMGGIQSFVIDSIVKAGVTWVLSLLNPASAFVRACKLIIDVIMFFVERGSQIVELVNAVLDSVGAIANGAIGTAAKLVEGALGKALPVVISFMASLIGLGGISGKIRGLIEKARGLIDKAIDWVLSKALAFVKKIGKKLGFGKTTDKQNKDEGKHAEAFAAVDSLVNQAKKEGIKPEELNSRLARLKTKYKFKKLGVELKGDAIEVDAEINPVKVWQYGGKVKMKIIYDPAWPLDEFMSKAKAIQKAATLGELMTLPIDPITGKQASTKAKRGGEQDALREKVREFIVTKVVDKEEQLRLLAGLAMLQADHQVELQLMGKDKPGNLALIEGAMNRAMGWDDFRPALQQLPPSTVISSVVIDTSAIEKQKRNKKKVRQAGTAALLQEELLKYAVGAEKLSVRSWFKLE